MAKKSQGIGRIKKTKRKKGWYYQAILSFGYDENGKQITKSKGSYNLQTVKNWLKENNTSIYTPEIELSLSDYLYKYLEEEKLHTVKSNTYEYYMTRTRLYIEPYAIGDIKTGEITPEIATQYFKKLLLDTSKPIHNFMLMYLKGAFKHLHDNGEIALNPINTIKPKKYIKKAREALEEEQQQEILSELDLNDKRDLAIYMALNLGCRIGEIMGLKWEDISDDGLVNIETQYSRIEKSIYKDTGLKTINSKRENPLPPKAHKEIEKYRGTGYIFSDDGEKPFDRKRVQRRYKKICEKYNIESSFHCLRHTYITRLHDAGISPKTAQMLAGHSDIKTTLNIYTHVSEKEKRNSVKLMEDLF